MVSWFGHANKWTRKHLIKNRINPSPTFISIIFLMWLILYFFPMTYIVTTPEDYNLYFMTNDFYLPLHYTMIFININVVTHEHVWYHGSDMWTIERENV